MKDDDLVTVEEFSKLTTTLFSAAMGQVGWEVFLDDLSAKSGGICTHIIGFDAEAQMAIGMAYSGYDPDFMKTYGEYYAERNAWASGFMAHRSGIVVDCEAMCPSDQLVKTEFYNDWLRPQEDICHGGGALLFKSNTRLFGLGGNIRQKNSDKLKDRWLTLVGYLIPHMQQAFEISRTLAGGRLEGAIIADQNLRSIPGILIVSDQGRIVFANSVAQTMIARGFPVSCDLRGVVGYGYGQDSEEFGPGFLRHRLPPGSPSYATRVSRPGQPTTHQLRFIRLDPEAQITFPMEATLGYWGHCTLVLVTEIRPTSDAVDMLCQAHGLSRGEAEVASMIADGLSAREISERRNVSIHTARTQIKAAMSKTGVRRQTELAIQISKLSNTAGPTATVWVESQNPKAISGFRF